MKKVESLNKIKELRKKIQQWNHEYFDLQKPSVSDQVYDANLYLLEKLEKELNILNLNDEELANSPSQNIGANIDNRFSKHIHKVPMLSLNKAYSLQDLEKFSERIAKQFNNFNFYCEPKIDGLSISLHYKKGKLVLALTRGNGVEGEDVTHNVLQIKDIPQKIKYQEELEVRGEIYLSKKEFEKINAKLLKECKQTYANARNLASGTMRQLNSEIVYERNLNAFIYYVVEPLKHNLLTYSDAIFFLKNNNFPVNNEGKQFQTIHECYQFIKNIETQKNTWNYDVDGIVVKLEQFNYYDELGFTSKFPHSAIAFKYDDEIAQTKLLNIFPTVGRTGIITYNAKLEPVFINGTIVSAATLHNYTYIEKLKISINDIVKIKKAGEIIPKVVASLASRDQTTYQRIDFCPSCNSQLILSETHIDQFCTNSECPEVNIKKIIHFISKSGLNIEGIGEKQVRLFFKHNFLQNPIDIFNLEKYKKDILKLEGFQKKSVNNILEAIQKAKTTKLSSLLSALGIKYIGARTAKFLANKIPKLADYLTFDFNNLINEKDIGPKTITGLKDFFTNEVNKKIWLKIQEIDWNFEEYIKNNSQKLTGITFVITGTLQQTRKTIQEFLESHGAKISSTISKNTNYLIYGLNPGSKLAKANELSIKTLSEIEYMEFIDKLLK
ncbi:NAD-dependent DNA ligase LigA [Mycoplasma iguanae]|uniref:DNA ligase n=1 Tax=Mycoplasma iguanae TaxID=292461 RepID=A0ABY5RAR7_9MOLU|nr:NAD-dependent DNA ligase LigA [Mycoplasma iguanae]UVD81447.1 NAD-dependent DNA ligase LigA [Mycoplasma iguanae]